MTELIKVPSTANVKTRLQQRSMNNRVTTGSPQFSLSLEKETEGAKQDRNVAIGKHSLLLPPKALD
jgi:hypothetical protein